MNIISGEQWAEWKMSPVTQAFYKYILLKKQIIARQKMDMMCGPAENINPYTLSVMNGIEEACNGILTLTLEAMTQESHSYEEDAKAYRKMLKEIMGVENV